MIEFIDTDRRDLVAFEAKDELTTEDYRERLVPALEDIVEHGLRPRMLYVLGPDFEGFEAGALWADARLGLEHLADFERIALVSDQDWIQHAAHLFGALVPAPVRTFPLGELEAAKRWVSDDDTGSFEVAVERDRRRAVVEVHLRGALDEEREEDLVDRLRAELGDARELRILVEAVGFHGWSDLRALWLHLRFVLGQRSRLQRAAVVGDAAWQRRLVRTASAGLGAEVRFFEAAELSAARTWVRS